MDVLPHKRLAQRLPLVTRSAHVLAFGLRGRQRFFEGQTAFSSTRDNEAGCAVTPFAAFSLAASSGIVMSDLASTHTSKIGRYGASLPPLGGRP